MMYAEIEYGAGEARLWGDFTEETVESAFMQAANECFGIRKSIMRFTLTKIAQCAGLPAPWNLMTGAATVLEHNNGGPGWALKDTAVFDGDGGKIKSEWD